MAILQWNAVDNCTSAVKDALAEFKSLCSEMKTWFYHIQIELEIVKTIDWLIA